MSCESSRSASPTEPAVQVDRRLTHVELLHAPGERDLAARILELLGCVVVDGGGHWFTAFVDGALRDYANNAFYVSEVSDAQLALESTLSVATADWVRFVRSAPQMSPHFGLRVGSIQEHRQILEDIERACIEDPRLRGRVEILGLFPHDAPGAIAPNMDQAFLWTDVLASGPLRFGQVFEVQWHLDAEPA